MSSRSQGRCRSALSRYLSEIRAYPILSKEEEFGIGEQISAGRREAADELVVSNLGFVVKIASEYQKMGLPFEDLLNEGNIGLIHAASRYDHRKGIKFITYASWWVRKSVLKALADQASLIRIPSYQRRRLAEQRAENEALMAHHDHPSADPSSGERARDRAAPPRYRPVSLDDPSCPEHHARLIEILVDDSSEDPEREIIRKEGLANLELSFSCLDDKERAIITRRFGLSGSRVLTLKEIGASMGLSRERVRQIEMAARDKLRSQLSRGRLLKSRPAHGRGLAVAATSA